jgi:hypothetical protein
MLVVWDLVNLGQFDHTNQMKTLSVITSSGFHCITISTSPQFFFLFYNWQGDSGGPIFFHEKQVDPILIGVLSLGDLYGGILILFVKHIHFPRI